MCWMLVADVTPSFAGENEIEYPVEDLKGDSALLDGILDPCEPST